MFEMFSLSNLLLVLGSVTSLEEFTLAELSEESARPKVYEKLKKYWWTFKKKAYNL